MARYYVTGPQYRTYVTSKGPLNPDILEACAALGRAAGESLKYRNENMEHEASLAQLDLIESLKKMVPDASTTQIGRVVKMADAGRAIDYLHSCMGGVPIRPETRSRIFVLLKADAYGADKDSMKLALDIATLGKDGNERDGQRAIRWLEARAKHGPDVGFEMPAPQPEPVKSTGRPRFDPRRKPCLRVAPAPQPVAVAVAVAVAPMEEAPVYDRRNDFHANPGYLYIPGRAEPCRVSRPVPAGVKTWLCEDQSIPENVLAAGRSERVAPAPAPAPVVTAPRPARVVPGRPATLPPARPATPRPVESAAASKFVRMGTIPLEHGWHPSDDLIPF